MFVDVDDCKQVNISPTEMRRSSEKWVSGSTTLNRKLLMRKKIERFVRESIFIVSCFASHSSEEEIIKLSSVHGLSAQQEQEVFKEAHKNKKRK